MSNNRYMNQNIVVYIQQNSAYLQLLQLTYPMDVMKENHTKPCMSEEERQILDFSLVVKWKKTRK